MHLYLLVCFSQCEFADIAITLQVMVFSLARIIAVEFEFSLTCKIFKKYTYMYIRLLYSILYNIDLCLVTCTCDILFVSFDS